MISSWLEFVPMLLEGAKVTVSIGFLSAIVAIGAAFVAGIARMSRFLMIRKATSLYVEFFRGTSLLIQLFWLYFALPFAGIELPKFVAAVLAIGLNYGAYGSEIVRSSIQAVSKGQWEAAVALNMKYWQCMVTVILPQAVVRMLPPLGNLMIELVKGTSLVYFITLSDLTYQAMVLRNNYISWTPEILGMLLLLYFAITSLIAFLFRKAERSLTVGRV